MYLYTDVSKLLQHRDSISTNFNITLSINSFALYIPPNPLSSLKKSNVVLISGITHAIGDQFLNLFFKSSLKCGGGEFERPMDIDRRNGKALVFYMNNEGIFEIIVTLKYAVIPVL